MTTCWKRSGTPAFSTSSDAVIRCFPPCRAEPRFGVMVLLVVAGGAAWFFSKHLPTSFLPDEDQGYLYINMQLPKAASMERTSAAAKQVEQVLAKTPGVPSPTSFVGFSLLSYVRTSYNAFFWVSLKPW